VLEGRLVEPAPRQVPLAPQGHLVPVLAQG